MYMTTFVMNYKLLRQMGVLVNPKSLLLAERFQ
jgi:hypothetical protein